MSVLPPNQPRGQGIPQPGKTLDANEKPQADGNSGKATASLVLACLALASMTVTAPLAIFAMLATYPANGPSAMPWVAPLVFFSLPLLLALPSLSLSIPIVYGQSRSSPGRTSATVALCIGGLVIALALGPALDQLGNL